MTIHSSILSARDRNPRIKNHGVAHIFNNFIHSFKYSGASAGANSIVYSQNNVFSAQNANNPRMSLSGITNNGGTVGRVFSSGDIFLDRSSHHGDVRLNSASSIRLPYRYSLKPASRVRSYVQANAGAAKAGNSGSDSDNDVEIAAANPRPSSTPTPDTGNEPTSNNCTVETKTIRFVRRTR
jgi:pectate lyase